MNTRLSVENSNNFGDADNTNMGALYSRLMRKSNDKSNHTNEHKSNGNSNNAKSSMANSSEIYRRKLRTKTTEPRIRRSERLKAKNNEMKGNSMKSDEQQSKKGSNKVSASKIRRSKRKKSVVSLKENEIMKIVEEAVGHTLNKNKCKRKGQPLLHYKSKRKKDRKTATFMCMCEPSVHSDEVSTKMNMERTIYTCTCPSTLATIESCINCNSKVKHFNDEINKQTTRSNHQLSKNSAISSSSSSAPFTKFCTCKDYYDELKNKANKENKQQKRKLQQNNARQKLLNTRRNLLMNKDYCKYSDGDSIFENNKLRYNNDYSNLSEEPKINTYRKNNKKQNKKKRVSNININDIKKVLKRKVITNKKQFKQNHLINQQKLLISLKDYLNTKIGDKCLNYHHFANNCPCHWVKHGTWNTPH